MSNHSLCPRYNICSSSDANSLGRSFICGLLKISSFSINSNLLDNAPRDCSVLGILCPSLLYSVFTSGKDVHANYQVSRKIVVVCLVFLVHF